MHKKARKYFNDNFTQEKYQKVKDHFQENFPDSLGFRLSETPIFLSHEFGDKLIDACDSIIDQIIHSDIMTDDSAIPAEFKAPNPIKKPHVLAIDFGICKNENGELEPQLIELQAFPSLFFYQNELANIFREVYQLGEKYALTPRNSFKEDLYRDTLQKLLVGEHKTENVILLELFPEKMKTRIDFKVTEKEIGIETVCLTEIKKEGEDLYYIHDGVKTPIYRVYNRVIFDDFAAHENLELEFNPITDSVNVEWITHPDWFYKISKYILPKLNHQFVPKTYFADEFPAGENIAEYVLKPLFSYSGKGVNVNPTEKDLEEIQHPHDWIVQKKVEYAAAFEDIEGDFAKAEIRMLFVWFPEKAKPELVINLVRMTKAEKVNVEHLGKEKIWTGSSVAFFEV